MSLTRVYCTKFNQSNWFIRSYFLQFTVVIVHHIGECLPSVRRRLRSVNTDTYPVDVLITGIVSLHPVPVILGISCGVYVIKPRNIICLLFSEYVNDVTVCGNKSFGTVGFFRVAVSVLLSTTIICTIPGKPIAIHFSAEFN